MADCPECEYCCLIGLCCTPTQQAAALTAAFIKAGAAEADARTYAAVVVDARAKAQKKA